MYAVAAIPRHCRSRPEGLKLGDQMAESGEGFLGRGQLDPSHQPGVWECCKLSQWKLLIFSYFWTSENPANDITKTHIYL